MDSHRYHQNTLASKERGNTPIQAFTGIFNRSRVALEEVMSLQVTNHTLETLMSHHIVNTVTAIETYYRDMIRFIFRICDEDSYKKYLKNIHRKKYSIEEVFELHLKGINPVDVIPESINFQNIDAINDVFSSLLNMKFLSEIKRFRSVKTTSGDICLKIEQKHIESLKDVFKERHRLIHSPTGGFTKPMQELFVDIDQSLKFVLASDAVFTMFCNKHCKVGPR